MLKWNKASQKTSYIQQIDEHTNLNDISFIKIQETDHSLVQRRNSDQLNASSCEIP